VIEETKVQQRKTVKMPALSRLMIQDEEERIATLLEDIHAFRSVRERQHGLPRSAPGEHGNLKVVHHNRKSRCTNETEMRSITIRL